MSRALLVLLALLAFGAARVPAERGLARELRAAHFLQGQLSFGLREQVGQMGFVAALSGFRAIVADGLWIRAFLAWEETEWGRLKLQLDGATALQPRAVLFWSGAANYMAYDASVAALRNADQPREALRIRAQREYFRLGEDYLLRGSTFNPDRAKLFDQLGQLYRDKFEDPCRAAWAYGEAAKRPDAMGYTHRFAAYALAKCPGHERAALDLLKQYYHRGESERLPTLLKLIDQLQHKLSLPPEQRLDVSEDLKKATPP